MRTTIRSLGLLMLAVTQLTSIASVHAQAALPAPQGSAVPTTKVLAIGRLLAPRQSEGFQKVMPSEVRATVDLYLKGKIDQWYVKQDGTGVVFIMNVTTLDEAHALLEALPLGEAKLMAFDLISLGPLNPLRMLIKP